ncbi:nuclear transport factor 2 family protein [Undibacterium sp. Ren11W]|uniref:nuclear transport factor 2 family protein n=1 Tax=Undibacterium sp. Ren11W TaxID=3413045 RepID=UPI003BF43D59
MNTTEQEIRTLEEQLRLAMLTGDVAKLDQLICADIIFTNHLGQLFTKEDDLALHRSGVLKFIGMQLLEQHIKIQQNTAVVSARMLLSGTYADAPFDGDLRYTRVWQQSDTGSWHIIAGHISAISV